MKGKSSLLISAWPLLVLMAFATPAHALCPYFSFCHVASVNYGSSALTLVSAGVHHPDGSVPSVIRSVTVEGPDGFDPVVLTSANYSASSKEYYKYVSGFPPVGQYKFTVLDTSGRTATTYYYLPQADGVLPTPSLAGAYGDMSAPTLSWSDLDIQANFLFEVFVYDNKKTQVWYSDVTGETSVTVPSGILASGKTYYWHLRAEDNSQPVLADNASDSGMFPCLLNSDPGFKYARVYSLSLPGSGASTALDVESTSTGDILPENYSLTVSGPGGFTYTFQSSDYNQASNNYYHILPGVPADGMYTFAVNDTSPDPATQLVTSYHYFKSATVPPADETTLQASGDPLAPTLTWAAPASDVPLFYSVAIWDKASGDKAWGVQGTSSTGCTVPTGNLLSDHTYQWQLDVQDAISPNLPNNVARTNKVELATDDTMPNFLYGGAGVYILNSPEGIFTVLDMDVNDPSPNGAGLSQSMTLTVSAPDRSSYTLGPGDLYQSAIPVPAGEPRQYEYDHPVPGVLPDGIYTFTLDYPVGQSRQTLVTRCAMHDYGRVPIVDETTFQVTGSDPLTPTVSWGGIAGYPGHLDYRLKIVDSNGVIIFNSSRSPETSQTVPAGTLEAGKIYQFRVEATERHPWVIYNNRSNTDYHPLDLTKDTPPGAPADVAAVPGDARATVSFAAPASIGGSPITHYTVTSDPGGRKAGGENSPITVRGLTNGTPYTFTVRAANEAGTGPASDPSAAVTPVGAPDAPTKVTATWGDREAVVSFNSPADGGSPLTGPYYTVKSHPGGITVTGAGSPITVPGLTNGVGYTFTVMATNRIGNGPWSAHSDKVTPATTPGAPRIGKVRAGNATATVSFRPPASDGGSRITSYVVTSSRGQTASGPGSPLTVKGLTNGTGYTFTVVAENKAGTGPESSPSEQVTPKQ